MQKRTMFRFFLASSVIIILLIALFLYLYPKNPTNQNLPIQINTQNSTTIVAVGDISCASEKSSGQECHDDSVASLIETINPGQILLLGDIQYEKGEFENFMKFFDPTWGRFKEKIKAVPGNHEYSTPNADGYYRYFPNMRGVLDKGYYSYDLDQWKVFALNSNCSAIGGCSTSSDQYTWLKEELNKTSTKCQLAFWHEPLYSSGLHGNSTTMKDIFKLLYDRKVEVVLSGHDHIYDRIQKADSEGNIEDDGIRSFVVGTGGRNLYPFLKPSKLSEIKQNSDYGVLKLSLSDNSYVWEFVSTRIDGFKDSGSDNCI